MMYLFADGQRGKNYESRHAELLWRTAVPVSLVFSPDSQHIAFWAQGKNFVRKCVVLDGVEGTLWNQILGSIVFDGNDGLHYLAADGWGQVHLIEEKVPGVAKTTQQ